MGKGKKVTQSESLNEIDKATWEPETIHILCDVCIKEIECGGKPESHFTKPGWKKVVDDFNKTSGRLYTEAQLKNKWDNLKSDYLLWKDLIAGDTGLGWDPIKSTVAASEKWWKDKLQAFPKAAKFKRRGIEPALHDKLSCIFSSIIATGASAWTPSSGALLGEGVDNAHDVVEGSGSSASGDKDYDSPDNITLNPSNTLPTPEKETQKKKRKNRNVDSTQPRLKKGKKVGGGKPGGAVKLLSRIDCLVEVVESRSTVQTTKVDLPGSIPDVVRQLKDLPEVPFGGDLYLFATRLFMTKEKKKMFFALDMELKVIWLKNELAKGGDI